MEISKEELTFLIKTARNTGFVAAFVACFCLFIMGGIFTFYIYKSYSAETSAVLQTQELKGRVNNNKGVITNENKTDTKS